MQENLTQLIDNFLKNPTKQSEIALIKALKNATFIAPVILNAPVVNQSSNPIQEDGENMKFITLVDDDTKSSFFPAFTSQSQMMKWRKDAEQESVSLSLKDYIAIIENSKQSYAGVVIDAFSYDFRLEYVILKKFYE